MDGTRAAARAAAGSEERATAGRAEVEGIFVSVDVEQRPAATAAAAAAAAAEEEEEEESQFAQVEAERAQMKNPCSGESVVVLGG